MKRFLVVLALLTPLSLFIFFRLFPDADRRATHSLFHFYIVSFASFSAGVVSILLSRRLLAMAQRRHTLAAVAFATIGLLFVSHGAATPNAIIGHSHPAVSWSAWLTMLVGGALFGLASLDRPDRQLASLSTRAITYGTAAFVGLYLAVAFLAPQLLDAIAQQAAPWHQRLIFWLTLLLWLVAAWRLWRIWQITRSEVDGSLALVASWLALGTISLHLFPVWHLSWWLYHFVLLLSFLVTAYYLVKAYEQARQFRLLDYYVAISLIFTSLLALVASALFAQISYNLLVSQLRIDFGSTIESQIENLAGRPNTPAGIRREVALGLVGLRVGNVLVFDEEGEIVYPDREEYGLTLDPKFGLMVAEAFHGEMVVEVLSSEETPADYAAGSNSYLIVVFVPIISGQERVGVAGVLRQSSELAQAVLQARLLGLALSGVVMLLLFLVLVLVVRRADAIIVRRSDELRQANQDLHHSEQMRQELTDMIVHDLRNPLAAINASLDMMGRVDESRPGVKERLVAIGRSAGQRMNSMIDDVLAVGKLEAGELPLKIEPVDLNKWLDEQLQTFMPQIESEKKTLQVDCPTSTFHFDSHLIGRVVDNLLNNALKYTISGEGLIAIRLTLNQDRLYFHVQDNGEGIPDQFKGQIFRKYVQVPDSSDGPRRKGTGLGLTFCQMVVQAHGGDIYVQDGPAGGSEFVFWLPKR